MIKQVVHTFSTQDLLRFGWITTYEEGWGRFVTACVMIEETDYNRFLETLKIRKPRSTCLLQLAKDVIVFRNEEGKIITGGSTYGSLVETLPSIDSFCKQLNDSSSIH